MIVGEYQAKTGDSFSVSEGLWKYIVEHSPEIAKRAELQVKSTEGQDKPKRTNKPKQP